MWCAEKLTQELECGVGTFSLPGASECTQCGDGPIRLVGVASFGGDVRDDADLALELLKVYSIALDVLTNKVVEGAVVRALRVLAVD